MQLTRLFAGVSLFVGSFVFAQGRPAAPGNPVADPPQIVVDSVGTLVGEVLKVEGVGMSAASVKYPLPGGEYVVLSVTGGSIATIGLPPHSGNAPDFANIYFKEADCSGDAYLSLHRGPGPAAQLTKKQALIVAGILMPPPVPPTGTCPLPTGSQWLFTRDSAERCSILADPNQSVVFQAYWGFNMNDPSNNCVPVAGGVTFGGPAPTSQLTAFGMFTRYQRIEDLMAKFVAPFHIP